MILQFLMVVLTTICVATAHTGSSTIAPTTESAYETAKKSFQAELASISGGEIGHLAKRQAILTRAIRATYHYHCPNAAETTRAFVWEAVYQFSDHSITLKPIDNIAKFTNMQTLHDAFSAMWYGNYCTNVRGLLCSWVFQGYTQGTVSDSGIVLDLVISTNFSNLMPKVHELCVTQVPGHWVMCPVVDLQSSIYCPISRIDIAVVN